METEKILDQIKKLKTKEGLKNHWTFLAVPFIFLLALYLRYLPEQGMQNLQALDPYWIFRQSQHLALEGGIPAVDFMRFFPYNAPFYSLDLGNIVFPAIFYWLGPFLFFGSYLEWAQFYPALMGASGVALMYFLGKELFDRITGVSAAFFLATIPGVLHRTSAGFFEKEPIGTFFMMVSLYFFTRGWIRREQISGILSGIALGFFTLSWGGSKMLWLLYPLVVGIMMWINEDIEDLVAVYTPTVILGGFIASIFSPVRFWFTGEFFLANIALLLFLWSRYLVEEFELLKPNQIGYYVPTASLFGLIALLLSPLYSDFIAKKFIAVTNTLEFGGSVIGGTVAENQAASIGQIAGQLGSVPARNIGFILEIPGAAAVGQLLSIIGNINGAWPLAFIGVILMGTKVSSMLLRKIGLIGEKIHERDYAKMILIVTAVWTGVFSFLFQSSVVYAVMPSVIGILSGLGILYALEEFEEIEIEFEWYYMLPLAWVVSNVLGAVSTSRLIFLAAFPVALTAGYMFGKVIKRLKSIDASSNIYIAALIVIVVLTAVVNISASYSSANSLGGSPNQLWMDNLDYMSEETPEGSVILSWWDYGYWFQSIGERASVADGGNLKYYSSSGAVNYPLADYLTSDADGNHTGFLQKHSVDYIVLDETMIGKYSAVSQISNRDNSNFDSMIQLNTDNDIRNSLDQNQSLLSASRRGGITVYAPIEQGSESISLSTNPDRKPNLELQRGAGVARNDVSCVITEDGITEFENVTEPARLSGFGELCLAENPYYSIERAFATSQASDFPSRQAKLVLVPKKIADSNLVRLYLMDGYGMDYVEKVEEGSNGFVKMWKVDTEEG